MEIALITALERALSDWAIAIGPEYVTTDLQSLQACQTATFQTRQQVPALLRPETREELQECLRIACRHEVPVYVVSTGYNWGYGSRAPAKGNCVVIELR